MSGAKPTIGRAVMGFAALNPSYASHFSARPRASGDPALDSRLRGNERKLLPVCPHSVFTCQTANAARARLAGFAPNQASLPVFFVEAPGRPVFFVSFRRPSKKTEGARDARVPMDPRASTPRDIEACRSPGSAASPPNPKASRARCFLGLLRADPGGQTIFTHRCGPWALLRHLYPVTACRAAGPSRLGPPGLATASPIAKEFPGHRSPPRVWRR